MQTILRLKNINNVLEAKKVKRKNNNEQKTGKEKSELRLTIL